MAKIASPKSCGESSRISVNTFREKVDGGVGGLAIDFGERVGRECGDDIVDGKGHDVAGLVDSM
eukprot:scaffold64346_cov46-Attheya_sp.AAC.1